jgi:hypothetical protein
MHRVTPAELGGSDKSAVVIGPFGSSLKRSDFKDSGVPLIFVRDIRTGDFSKPRAFVSEEKARELKAHLALPGDLVVTKMGDPPGDVAIYDGHVPAVITADCIRIRPTDRYDQRYLLHAFRAPQVRQQVLDITSGAAQKKMSLERFRTRVAVPVPSPDEQRRIAGILDHADSVRAKRGQVLVHLNSLTQSVFHDLFASGVQETRPLGDVAELRAGVGFPPRLQGRTAGDYPMAKVGDIGRVGRSAVETIESADHWVDEADLTVLKMRPVPAGSVLFAKIGEAIRHNHRVIAGRSLLLDNNAMAAIPGDSVSAPYLFAYLKTVDFYALASSTTVPSLRKSDLAALPVPLPSTSEQSKFEAHFAQINTVRAKVQQAAIADDQLFESLQFRAFRGEL